MGEARTASGRAFLEVGCVTMRPWRHTDVDVQRAVDTFGAGEITPIRPTEIDESGLDAMRLRA